MPKKPKTEHSVNVLTIVDFENRRVTEFISQAEAARHLDVSRATVNFLVSKGRLRSEVIAGRKVVYVEDVLAYSPARPGPKKGSNKSSKLKKEARTTKRASKKAKK